MPRAVISTAVIVLCTVTLLAAAHWLNGLIEHRERQARAEARLQGADEWPGDADFERRSALDDMARAKSDFTGTTIKDAVVIAACVAGLTPAWRAGRRMMSTRRLVLTGAIGALLLGALLAGSLLLLMASIRHS